MMRTHRSVCVAKPIAAPDFVDITGEIQQALHGSGIRDGQVTVFSADKACSIVLNERESGLWSDVKRTLERLGATEPSDRRTLLASSSVTLPVVGGELRLGTWQRVLFVELEEACDRTVSIQIVGE
jgi:secondary thiamine-phosphate synthase enzyme